MRKIDGFETEHDDYILDICYDYYGQKIATTSADHTIKIWQRQEDDGQWKLDAKLQGFKGPILKMDWAHPEFGQIIACCSNGNICIWEEHRSIISQQQTDNSIDELPNNNISSALLNRWREVAKISDADSTVYSIKFSPKHLGLQLACCGASGSVRIYSANDVTSLVHWSLQYEFETEKNISSTCLSWNPSQFDPSMICVGNNNNNSTVWKLDPKKQRWIKIIDLPKTNDGSINDISWAPNLGRSYHLIATSSTDGIATIWKLNKNKSIDSTQQQQNMEIENLPDNNTINEYQADSIQKIQHGSEVWKVEWNITGTILATSGDDGIVRLWRNNFQNGNWICYSEMTGEM